MGWLASLFRKPSPAPGPAVTAVETLMRLARERLEREASLDARLAARRAEREFRSAAARAGAATKARNRIANDRLRREQVPL